MRTDEAIFAVICAEHPYREGNTSSLDPDERDRVRAALLALPPQPPPVHERRSDLHILYALRRGTTRVDGTDVSLTTDELEHVAQALDARRPIGSRLELDRAFEALRKRCGPDFALLDFIDRALAEVCDVVAQNIADANDRAALARTTTDLLRAFKRGLAQAFELRRAHEMRKRGAH